MKEVFILGGGAKARHFDISAVDDLDRDVEIWGVNFMFNKHDWAPRWDRMFNLHRYDLLKRYGYPCYRDAEWAAGRGRETRVILADKWPDGRMTNAEIFPRDKIAERYPAARNNYHVNSCDWLIAYALFEGFKVCHLHGFQLEREGPVEQMSAAKCAEYWAGFAEACDMKIIVEKDSSMFGVYHMVKTNRVYGYDDCPAWEDRTTGAPDDPPYRYDDY